MRKFASKGLVPTELQLDQRLGFFSFQICLVSERGVRLHQIFRHIGAGCPASAYRDSTFGRSEKLIPDGVICVQGMVPGLGRKLQAAVALYDEGDEIEVRIFCFIWYDKHVQVL